MGSFSSYNSVIYYLSCLKQVNLYLGADVKFFASPKINFLKQASKRVLAKSPARKLPITVNILLAIFKCLDFRLPLHVSMWAIFLVAFFSLLRKSNLVPTTLADVASNSATHLRMCDISFTRTIVYSMYTKPTLFNSGRGPFKLSYLSSLIQSCVLFLPCSIILQISLKIIGHLYLLFTPQQGSSLLQGIILLNFLSPA